MSGSSRTTARLLPAERFLAVVQGRVLDAIFGSLARADPVTRYYLAAQYSYGYAAVPFDEANNLARMTGVDLDSPHGLTGGRNSLVLKQGSTVALRDFEDRGDDPQLGLPVEGNGLPALLDVAHGVLWRAEHRPSELRAYLLDARPDSELLRQVIQALAGKALRSDERQREVAGGRRCRTPAGLLAAIRRGHPVRVMKEVAWTPMPPATGCVSLSGRTARNGTESISKQPCPEPSHE